MATPRQTIFKVECTKGSGSGRKCYQLTRSRGPIWPTARGRRYTRHDVSAFEVTTALSSIHPRGWQPLMETRPCVPTRTCSGGVIRSLSPTLRPYFSLEAQVPLTVASLVCRCSSVVARWRFELKPIAPATTISIPAGNKASDLWRRFIAVFIAAPSTHCPHRQSVVQVRAKRIRLHRDKGMQFLDHVHATSAGTLPSTFFIRRGPVSLSFLSQCLRWLQGSRETWYINISKSESIYLENFIFFRQKTTDHFFLLIFIFLKANLGFKN